MLFYREEDVITFDSKFPNSQTPHAIVMRRRLKTVLGTGWIIVKPFRKHCIKRENAFGATIKRL